MSRELGAFAGYEENRADMLRVIRNHRRAAYDVTRNATSKRGIGEYEGLEIKPVGTRMKRSSARSHSLASDSIAEDAAPGMLGPGAV